MKISVIRLFTILTIACGFIVSANAQEETQVQQQQQGRKSPEQRIEKRLARLKADLNLTDEQIPKVKEVLITRENARTAKTGSATAADAKANKKKMMDDMSKILTPEQMTKFKQMKAKGKNQMEANPAKEN